MASDETPRTEDAWSMEGLVAAFRPPPLKAGRMVRFAKTDVDVVVARPPAPGRLGTSQLSNPGTQWVMLCTIERSWHAGLLEGHT